MRVMRLPQSNKEFISYATYRRARDHRTLLVSDSWMDGEIDVWMAEANPS